MSVSSGTVSLFASVGFFIAAAAGAAYGLKHKDEVKRFVVEVAGINLDRLAGKAQGLNNQNDASGDDASANAGDVTLRANGSGHFETSAEVNGRDVDVMIDTGATLVALTYEDAERAGIYVKPVDFSGGVSTANGAAKFAPITIESISIGNITVRNIQGGVMERGKLNRTLLGMSFLGKLSRVEMRRNALVLHE